MYRLSRMSRLAACLAVVAALPSPAAARDYYYFNKPGVDREAYAADITECTELAGGARTPDIGPIYYSGPAAYAGYAAAIGGLFAGLMQGAENRRLKRSVERTCMADKGYGRFETDKKLIREIENIKDDAARLDRLFGLASAADPVGTRMEE